MKEKSKVELAVGVFVVAGIAALLMLSLKVSNLSEFGLVCAINNHAHVLFGMKARHFAPLVVAPPLLNDKADVSVVLLLDCFLALVVTTSVYLLAKLEAVITFGER